MRFKFIKMGYTGKWIFIRFNPDKYTDKDGKRRNPEIATRLMRMT
jgi:hypothetical protein